MGVIEKATAADKDEVLKLYKAQLGREYCPWDDEYPGNGCHYAFNQAVVFEIRQHKGRCINEHRNGRKKINGKLGAHDGKHHQNCQG